MSSTDWQVLLAVTQYFCLSDITATILTLWPCCLTTHYILMLRTFIKTQFKSQIEQTDIEDLPVLQEAKMQFKV